MICKKCKRDHDETFFNWKQKKLGKRRVICKDCSRKEYRDHYQANKRKVYGRNKMRRQKLRVWVNEYKSSLQCARCPENDAACLDFHHPDATKKEIDITTAIQNGWSRQRIMTEIEKCKVLCSNCHRKHHHASIV